MWSNGTETKMGIYVYFVCVYVNKYCESYVLRAQMCFFH